MRKYYTRACNFSYGLEARDLIKKKLALPLCGNKNIAFKQIEILSPWARSLPQKWEKGLAIQTGYSSTPDQAGLNENRVFA